MRYPQASPIALVFYDTGFGYGVTSLDDSLGNGMPFLWRRGLGVVYYMTADKKFERVAAE